MKCTVAPVQQILEEQGYLIFVSRKTYAVGEVIPTLYAVGHADVSGPMVIIGSATREEFDRQGERFFGLREPDWNVPDVRYYRAAAE